MPELPNNESCKCGLCGALIPPNSQFAHRFQCPYQGKGLAKTIKKLNRRVRALETQLKQYQQRKR